MISHNILVQDIEDLEDIIANTIEKRIYCNEYVLANQLKQKSHPKGGFFHLIAKIQSTNTLASSSLTCALAGIGMGPHAPCPPFLTFPTKKETASLRSAYFVEISLNDGPTSFLSMAWHAKQFLDFRSVSLAIAGVANTATSASAEKSWIFTICPLVFIL